MRDDDDGMGQKLYMQNQAELRRTPVVVDRTDGESAWRALADNREYTSD